MAEILFEPELIASYIGELDEFAQDVLMLKYYCECDDVLIRESLDSDDIKIHAILEHAIKALAELLADGWPGKEADIERVIWGNPKKFLWDALDLLQKERTEALENQPDPRPEFLPDFRESLPMVAATKQIISDALRNNQTMQQLKDTIVAEQKKERRKLSAKKCAKAVLLAVLLSVGIAVIGVEGVRVKFLNMVMEAGEKAASLGFDMDSEYLSDEIELSYIPEGFELQEKNAEEGYLYLKFEKKELFFMVKTLKEHETYLIDTEDAEVGKTTVNGNEAIYSYKENVGTIAFHDENYTYTVSGNIPKKQLIDIAAGIRYKG